MTERRGYAICTVARSGSTWLSETLGSTGVLGHPSEYFSTDYQRITRDPDYPADRTAQVDIVLRRGATPNGVYAVKLFPMNLDDLPPRLRWSDRLPNLRFVHLRRRDLLGQALSRVRAVQTRQWRSTLPERAAPRYRGDDILQALRLTARQDARWLSYFARNGIEPLSLIYEDCLARVDGTVDAVAALMGVEPPRSAPGAAIEVAVQRDALTDEWRARFLAEFGGRDALDPL